MPELPDSNPLSLLSLFAPSPSTGSPPDNEPPGNVAIPPRIDPDRWEDFPVFRETFLAYFTVPKYNFALRTVGKMLLEMTLASWGEWPDQPEGLRRAELRAAVADLRHLEGYLVTAGSDPPDDPYEAALCRTAVLMSQEVGSVAEHIEAKLGTWRGEGPAS
jgi:hypothetical protein